MSRKFKNKVGYTIIQVTLKEMNKWGGLGICDYCNCLMGDGFLIGVLNMVYCNDCYKRFEKDTKIIKEKDKIIERLMKDSEGA